MKTISTIVLSLLITASYSMASGSKDADGQGLMTMFFITFVVLIVLFQSAPGFMLLGGMIKELFSKVEQKSLSAVRTK